MWVTSRFSSVQRYTYLLARAITAKLAELDGARFGSLSYSFNRKEEKDHGEVGSIVGCPLRGKRVLTVDDAITGGVAIH